MRHSEVWAGVERPGTGPSGRRRLSDVRQRTGYLFLLVLGLHIVLISAQVNTASGAGLLENLVFTAFSEVQRAISGTLDGVRRVWTGYADLRGARLEAEILQQRVTELSVRLQQQQALASRADRLEQVLGLRQAVEFETVGARVIGADPTPFFHTVTINKGTTSGVAPNLAVLAAEGVVGRTFGEVAPHAARVQLLIDRSAAAGAMLERSRVLGVVTGRGGDELLDMQYVSKLADVEPGDRVVTSGIDGLYPKGFVVGEVATAENGPGVYKTIRVRPAVDFATLEDVLVVLTPPPVPLPDEDIE